MEEGVLLVKRPATTRSLRPFHGLSRSLIHNMVVGVTSGYQKNLDIVGVGYRARCRVPSWY